MTVQNGTLAERIRTAKNGLREALSKKPTPKISHASEISTKLREHAKETLKRLRLR